jgi:hypothetical protein
VLLTKSDVSYVTCIKKYFEKNEKKQGDHAQIFGAMDITNYGDGINHILPELHVMQGTSLQNLNFVLLLVLVLRMLRRLSMY